VDLVQALCKLSQLVFLVNDGCLTSVLLLFLFIVSGGFATMNPDSTLNINAVEAFPVEEFSAEVGSFGP